ncbi:hypothetical protein BCV70DRAFT_200025 [Testicularia cyperi]|uniref:SWIM-type domain-containing protein n=1 Tax=Testicularia cyperi TaxID=1882483 RepID=A0A317XQY4_9BASI|nr:hypothetical protein BCV70DRAFT_200025 [Testicularia cyperi]
MSSSDVEVVNFVGPRADELRLRRSTRPTKPSLKQLEAIAAKVRQATRQKLKRQRAEDEEADELDSDTPRRTYRKPNAKNGKEEGSEEEAGTSQDASSENKKKAKEEKKKAKAKAKAEKDSAMSKKRKRTRLAAKAIFKDYKPDPTAPSIAKPGPITISDDDNADADKSTASGDESSDAALFPDQDVHFARRKATAKGKRKASSMGKTKGKPDPKAQAATTTLEADTNSINKKKPQKPRKLSRAAQEQIKMEEFKADPNFRRLDDSQIRRLARVFLDRMYLVHRQKSTIMPNQEEFQVFGSRGNIYRVTVDYECKCTCIDFVKNKSPCKHMLFVYYKVLRLPSSSPAYMFTTLGTAQLVQIFAEALADPVAEAVASKGVRKAWEEAIGYQGGEEASTSATTIETAKRPGKRILPEAGDLCGVCFEDLPKGSEENLEFCLESCGRPIHTDCLQMWFQNRSTDAYGRAMEKTCIWCRAPWPESKTEDRDRSSGFYDEYRGYGRGPDQRGVVRDQRTGLQLNLAAAAAAEGWEIANTA